MDFKDRIVELRRVPASELVENPKNWRRHGEDQRRGLRSLVEKIGFAGAELVRIMDDGRLMLIDGHLRKDEYKKQSLPVLVTDLSEAEADLLLATFDPIGALATTDDEALELLLSEVNATFDDLGDLLADVHGDEYIELPEVAEDAGAQIDKADELLQKWQVERGQLWVIPSKSGRGEHRLLCGDSTNADDVARVMAGERAQMLFTDPPYGVDYTGGHFHSGDVNIKRERDRLSGDGDAVLYHDFLPVVMPMVDGPCYMWFASSKSRDVYNALHDSKCEVHALIIWNKINATYAAMNAQYKQRHEPCVYFKPKGSTLRWVGASDECTVWDIKRDGQNEFHPTQKPVELAYRAIKNHDATTVLDCFAGSGFVFVACEQTGRLGRGLELEPKYCAVILQRLTDMGLTPNLTSDKFASQS